MCRTRRLPRSRSPRGRSILTLFSQKRTRSGRSGPASTRLDRARQVVGDAGLMSRLLVGLVAVLLTLVSVRAWESPFPYREGDYISHGIVSRLAFEREDMAETLRQQTDAEQQVPLVFRNRPLSIQDLPARLRADLGEVTASDTPSELSLETRRAFGFGGPEGTDAPTEQDLREFEALKAAVKAKGPMSADDRLRGIEEDFEKFLTPLVSSGVIDPRDKDRLNIRRSARLRIEPLEGTPEPPNKIQPVPLTKVQLSDQLTDAGELGQSWPYYPNLSEELQPLIKRWLRVQLEPTLEYDGAATISAREAARDSVSVVKEPYSRREILVDPRTVLTSEQVALLLAEHEAVEAEVTTTGRVVRFLLETVLVAVLAVLNGYYLVRTDPRVVRSLSRLTVYAASVVLTVALARWLSFDPYRAEVVPLVAATLVFCIAYNQVLATVLAVTLCLLLTLATTASDLSHFVVLMATTAASVLVVGRVRTRTRLVRVGVIVAAVHFVVMYAVRTLVAQEPFEILESTAILREAILGSAWCLFCGFLVTGALPLVERIFGVVTDISLLELSDVSNALLKELVVRAPGTYQHSLNVASISESAAESIGANGLLCRVGAYFHDVGKMLKPDYFIENLEAGAVSPHLDLAPTMSTLVIIGHVKDGVDLADKYNLPAPIVDFIEQHHGTTLVEYFFRAAAKRAEEDPSRRTEADEESFRYPGPKPQTKEAGVMMLVDCCESATRAIGDLTPARIKQLVRDLMMKRLLDGQFDECNLTLSELHTVERSIAKSLIAMHHGRIKYPGGEDGAATAARKPPGPTQPGSQKLAASRPEAVAKSA